MSLSFAALCRWVLLPLFVSVGLVALGLTMLAGAAAVAAYLVAVGSPSE